MLLLHPMFLIKRNHHQNQKQGQGIQAQVENQNQAKILMKRIMMRAIILKAPRGVIRVVRDTHHEQKMAQMITTQAAHQGKEVIPVDTDQEVLQRIVAQKVMKRIMIEIHCHRLRNILIEANLQDQALHIDHHHQDAEKGKKRRRIQRS